MHSHKIKAGYRFRIHNKPYKRGIYFGNIMDHPKDTYRLKDKDVVEMRDFLSRYINKYINQKNNETEVSIRAHLHAALRGINILEANK